jgi:putative transposase
MGHIPADERDQRRWSRRCVVRLHFPARRRLIGRVGSLCESFRQFLNNEGIKSVRLPPRSPNMSAHLERFFGSLKSECINRLILFGEGATRNAVRQYLAHYHAERNHQGLSNELIVPHGHPPDIGAQIETSERIGGLLRSYRRAA